MASELTLTVNGVKQAVSSAPDTPLLFVLRNELKLTGPHLGCGMAQCGACSGLLDGAEIRSCVTPVSVAAAKRGKTDQGLPRVRGSHKVVSGGDPAPTPPPRHQPSMSCPASQAG